MQETNVIEQSQPIEAVGTEIAAPAPTMTLCSYGNKLTREELAQLRTPAGAATHKPIPHITVVEKLIEALSFHQIGVVREEYAVSSDGMRMFGVMDLSSGFEGCRFALGLRNSHDKTFRLSLSVGRIFVCENLAFHGDFIAVLAKHSKHFSLEDSLSIGVDRMQRNFGALKNQVEEWQAMQLSRLRPSCSPIRRSSRRKLGFPNTWRGECMTCTFSRYTRSSSRGPCGALSNAFTSAFKELEPIPQYKATAKLAGFLQAVRPC